MTGAPTPPGPPWHVGDTVGTPDPDDQTTWTKTDHPGRMRPNVWLRVNPRTTGPFSFHWVDDSDLPADAVLLVRAGRSAPETTPTPGGVPRAHRIP